MGGAGLGPASQRRLPSWRSHQAGPRGTAARGSSATVSSMRTCARAMSGRLTASWRASATSSHADSGPGRKWRWMTAMRTTESMSPSPSSRSAGWPKTSGARYRPRELSAAASQTRPTIGALRAGVLGMTCHPWRMRLRVRASFSLSVWCSMPIPVRWVRQALPPGVGRGGVERGRETPLTMSSDRQAPPFAGLGCRGASKRCARHAAASPRRWAPRRRSDDCDRRPVRGCRTSGSDRAVFGRQSRRSRRQSSS
jgi:hypothetical protein